MTDTKQLFEIICSELTLCSCEVICSDPNDIVIIFGRSAVGLKMCTSLHKKSYVTREYVKFEDFTEDYLIIRSLHSS